MVKNRPKWWLPVAERILGGIISVEGIVGQCVYVCCINMMYCVLLQTGCPKHCLCAMFPRLGALYVLDASAHFFNAGWSGRFTF